MHEFAHLSSLGLRWSNVRTGFWVWSGSQSEKSPLLPSSLTFTALKLFSFKMSKDIRIKLWMVNWIYFKTWKWCNLSLSFSFLANFSNLLKSPTVLHSWLAQSVLNKKIFSFFLQAYSTYSMFLKKDMNNK